MGDWLAMSQKGLTGGWTKYGGARQHVVKTHIDKTWFCQCCGQERPKELSPFLFEFQQGDFIRVCANCLHDGVVIIEERKIEIELLG